MGTYTGSDKRLQYLFQNGGGGGGTTVIANPQGQATDTLNKLQVGSTIYGVSGGGSSGHNYSTTEQVIGTWTDGKPLYEKTYEGTTASTSGIYAIIDNGSDTVIRRFDGEIGGRGLNSYYDAANYCRLWITSNKYQIGVLPSGSSFLSQPYSITLQYTKTTD